MEQIEMLSFLNKFGLMFLFVIVLLEYLNLPGFPAGIIFPVAGLWVQYGGHSFLVVLLVTIVAGILGSFALYLVGRIGGSVLLDKFCTRYPKTKPTIDKYVYKMQKNANITVFVAKFVPVARTSIGFPAGAIRMNLVNYLVFSTIGIIIWNAAVIFCGFAFGEAILSFFS